MRILEATVIVSLLLVSVATAAAQAAPDSAAHRTAMARLAYLAGDWGGPAVYQGRGGRPDTLWQTEHVVYKLRGQILLIEGLGRRGVPEALGDTAFNAVAVVDWLPERGYVMRSHTLEGRQGAYPLELSESGFVWGFETAAGRVRYTMRITPAGEWHERGEFSRDGERWLPVLEMRLRRADP